MKKISIAIDGPSASGKSTIAKILAKKLDYVYIDTGAMYRCVAYYAINQGINLEDEQAINELLNRITITMDSDNNVYLNNENVSNKIREDHISMGASKVSSYLQVREFLVEQQRAMASSGGAILDGRDIGTVVLPNAQLKVFQVASVETRAMRRYKENLTRGLEANLELITQEIEQRDFQDTTRKHSPLKQADDAILVDTSNLSLDEVVAVVLELVEQAKEK